MAVTGKRMTAEELWRLPDDHMRHELIDGEFTTMPLAEAQHGCVTMDVGASLAEYVRAMALGHTFAAGTGFILARNPDLVRAPDVAFVRQERVAAAGRVRGYRVGAPDLAVEVVSPDDRAGDVAQKVAHWLAYGTPMVIVVYPDERRVRVHRPGQPPRDLGMTDAIDGEDVVPGWTLPLAELFS